MYDTRSDERTVWIRMAAVRVPAGKNVHISGPIEEQFERPVSPLLPLLLPFLRRASSSNWSCDLAPKLTSWTLPRVGSLSYSLSVSCYPSLLSGLPYVQWREQLYPVARSLFAGYTRRFCFPIIIRYRTSISLVIFNRWRIFPRLFIREFRSCHVLILCNVSRSG